MANEFVLTPAAWLRPASLFTPTPKAAQRVLEFSARRSITITRARLISTPRAAFRTCAMRGHRPAPRLRSQKYFRTINVQWIGKWGLFSLCGPSQLNNLHAVNTVISSTPAASTMPLIINYLQTHKFFKRLDAQSIVIFRTWVLL
jgi:hypothetical protein